MTSPLPPDIQTGSIVDGGPFGSATTVWAVVFKPSNTNRLLSRIAIVAPGGILAITKLILWMDTTKLSVAPSGIASEYEPYRPIPVAGGRTLYLVWYSNLAGTPPEGTLFTEGTFY